MVNVIFFQDINIQSNCLRQKKMASWVADVGKQGLKFKIESLIDELKGCQCTMKSLEKAKSVQILRFLYRKLINS